MIALIVIAVLLAAASVWFLLRPLAHATPAHEGHYQLLQLRDRLLVQLRELDMEEGDANVDPKVAADERLRLEAELARVLKDLDGPGGRSEVSEAAPTRIRRATVVVLAVIVPLTSAVLYFATNRVTLARLAQPQTQTAVPQVPPQVQEMVARLEKRLGEQPNDSKGWAMLARSYEVLGRPEDARKAYAQAYRLAPSDPEILAAYASFLMALNPTSPSPEAVALFRKLHAIEPRNPAALWTLGLVAFHSQQFREATGYWERLLKELPPDSEATPQVQRAIATAREAAKKK